jgi:hypothetical protein
MRETAIATPEVRTPSRPTLEADGAGSLARPDRPVDAAVATDPTPARAAVIPAAPSMAMMAASMRLPEPSEPAAQSGRSGQPDQASTVSTNPDATTSSKGRLEAAPLPPTRPRTLALADTPVRVDKQANAGARPAGVGSFSIQMASSRSRSDALATLSRLQKQFPDMLGDGSVRRADRGSSGVFYRVQAGPLSREAADKACTRLKAKGENCIVVR